MVGFDRLKASDNTGLAVLAHIESNRSIGGTVIDVDSVDNWPTNFIVTTGTLLGTGLIDPSTITEMYGHITSGDIIIDGFMPGSTDAGNTIGQVAVIKPSTGFADWLVETLRVEHADDGTHGAITPTSINGTTKANAAAGWRSFSGAVAYASATSVTVAAADYAAVEVGTKICITQTTAKYFYVTAKSGGNTLTLAAGSDYTVANAAITAPLFSNAETPVGFPQYFNYTPVWTGSTTNPAIVNGTIAGRFTMIGRAIRFRLKLIAGSSTTYGSGGYFFTLPVAAHSSLLNGDPIGTAILVDQGSASWYHVAILTDSTHYQLQFGNDASNPSKYNGTFTNSAPFALGNTDVVSVQGYYEVAA